MLRTENETMIYAPPDVVYELASDITKWPELLPHYRYVKILRQPDETASYRRRIKMGARRGIIPVSWTSSQVLRPSDHRINYFHIKGVTKGMDVEWRIERRGEGTRVTIIHALTSPYFWVQFSLVEFLLGWLFVSPIAERTLREIKALAEARMLEDRPV